MSFIPSVTRLRCASIPNFSIQNLRIGQGVDNGLVAFYCCNEFNKYVMTENSFAYKLSVDEGAGGIYSPVYNDVNGYIYWSLGSSYIYYSKTYGWILSSYFPGYEPEESYNSSTQQYEGDDFYVGSLANIGDNVTNIFTPRGVLRNTGSSLIVRTVFPRWQSVNGTFLGEYEPKDGVTGSKFLGTPRWRDGSGVSYVRSVEKNLGYFEYGDIQYSQGQWLIGTAGSASGWYEGGEPSKEASVTFVFKKNEGSEVTGSDKIVTFYDYVVGTEKTTAFLGEVAIWR